MSILDTIRFPPGSVAIMCKYNFSCELNDDGSHPYDKYKNVSKFYIRGVRTYHIEYGYDIIAQSVGIHTQGINERPHLHIHMVGVPKRDKALERISSSNPSRDRSAFLKKYEKKQKTDTSLPNIFLEDIEVKYEKVDVDSYHADILAYPVKEWTPLKPECVLPIENYKNEYEQMEISTQNALLQYASALWEKSKAEVERKRRAKLKTQGVRENILMIANLHKPKFGKDYKKYLQVLDEYYISNLEFEDYPRPNDYKVYCQQVAIKIGILKYSDLC